MQVGTYVEKMFKSELSGNVIGMLNCTVSCCHNFKEFLSK